MVGPCYVIDEYVPLKSTERYDYFSKRYMTSRYDIDMGQWELQKIVTCDTVFFLLKSNVIRGEINHIIMRHCHFEKAPACIPPQRGSMCVCYTPGEGSGNGPWWGSTRCMWT